jgi:hypothetical protein
MLPKKNVSQSKRGQVISARPLLAGFRAILRPGHLKIAILTVLAIIVLAKFSPQLLFAMLFSFCYIVADKFIGKLFDCYFEKPREK